MRGYHFSGIIECIVVDWMLHVAHSCRHRKVHFGGHKNIFTCKKFEILIIWCAHVLQFPAVKLAYCRYLTHRIALRGSQISSIRCCVLLSVSTNWCIYVSLYLVLSSKCLSSCVIWCAFWLETKCVRTGIIHYVYHLVYISLSLVFMGNSHSLC